MIELGIKGRQETTVTSANVATYVGSGEGTHERSIIDIEKFQAKAENK